MGEVDPPRLGRHRHLQVPQGLKPRCYPYLTARLKSCPPNWAKVVPLRLRPQVLQGLKRPVYSSLNGTTKVVPSQLERKSCAAWRPQVPQGLKPRCLSSLTARLKSCPATGNIGPHVSQRTARHRLRPLPQGLLKSLCLLSLMARLSRDLPPERNRAAAWSHKYRRG
jgi:hypothetical protein